MLSGTRGNAAGADLNRTFPAIDSTGCTSLSRWTSQTDHVVELLRWSRGRLEPETPALVGLVERLLAALGRLAARADGAIVESKLTPVGEHARAGDRAAAHDRGALSHLAVFSTDGRASAA